MIKINIDKPLVEIVIWKRHLDAPAIYLSGRRKMTGEDGVAIILGRFFPAAGHCLPPPG